MMSAVAYVIGPAIFDRTWTAAEDFLLGFGMDLLLQEIQLQVCMILRRFWCVGWCSSKSTHQNCAKNVVVTCYHYELLLRIRCLLLLISDMTIMCNNDVIMEYHYYAFLRIITYFWPLLNFLVSLVNTIMGGVESIKDFKNRIWFYTYVVGFLNCICFFQNSL